MGGGGGGQSGGTVVGGPSPQAAALAGQYQVQAAREASRQAEDMMNTAIIQLRQQYSQARYDVQPYRQEGVQALDQLNQYLGLDPYNPGSAPTAPTAPTLESLAQRISNSAVRSYIMENQSGVTNTAGQSFGNTRYTGTGQEFLGEPVKGNKGSDSGWTGTPKDAAIIGGNSSQILNNPNVKHAIKLELAEEDLPNAMDMYNQDVKDYGRNQEEWAQNKTWYDQYAAEGPFTSDQVYDKITNQPGYQAQLKQGIDAIQKAGSASGYIGSGRLLKELGSYGQNTLSQYYNDTLSRLAALAGSGQQAANTSAGLASQQGNSLANLYSSIGDIKANSTLAAGNAQAEALLAGNQQYKIIGGQDSGGGGMGGIGQALGAAGSLFSMFSSKRLKTKVSDVSVDEILKSVDSLNIDKWQYTNIERNHMGPYAEEFQKAFGVGDGQSINMIDAIGVLFGAVKALSQKIEKLQSEDGSCR